VDQLNVAVRRFLFWIVLGGACASACAAETGETELADEADVGLTQAALSGGFLLRNTNTGKCLTASRTAGDNATLQVCNGSEANQRWGFDGGFLKHTPSGLCLDVEGASQANGAAVQVFNCNGGSHQDFRFYPIFTAPGISVTNWHLVVKHSSKCVEQGGTTGPQVLQNNLCTAGWNVVF
jgi:hypothetical protein